MDWSPIQAALTAMFTATTGRLPQPPLVVFKMLLLQTCYGLSDPACEAQVRDRLSWRKFTGLSLTDPVPDETTLVRFRQRLVAHGLHERLLALVHQQLAAHGLLVRAVTLVDATLIQAARRVPRFRVDDAAPAPCNHPPMKPQSQTSLSAAGAVALLAFAVLVDLRTGEEISVFPLYMPPLIFAAWFLGLQWGLWLSVVAMLVRRWVNWHEGPQYSEE